jgi:hypothetical protein
MRNESPGHVLARIASCEVQSTIIVRIQCREVAFESTVAIVSVVRATTALYTLTVRHERWLGCAHGQKYSLLVVKVSSRASPSETRQRYEESVRRQQSIYIDSISDIQWCGCRSTCNESFRNRSGKESWSPIGGTSGASSVHGIGVIVSGRS